MLFRILGPLEVLHRDQQVAIGSAKQRATLGFLLLHANRVVPTSALLDALWPKSESPATARKILQNAVSGLRSTLSADPTHPGTLVTKAPGYMARVDDDQIDLFHFQRRVQEGRAELASGSARAASVVLGEALALWRGSALADLVEAGTTWPELTALENARIDAMEDYFDAELACGRHRTILGELERIVESEPLRERLRGQLMLALYRCGRQAAALNTYSRVRATLVADLGVEPGRELQLLQHAILNQDASLQLAAPGTPLVVQWPRPAEASAPTEVVRDFPAVRREQVSMLLAQTEFGCDHGDPVEPGDLVRRREEVARDIRGIVEDFGGSVVTAIGSFTLAVFNPPEWTQDHAERAVRVADAIVRRLGDVPAGPLLRAAVVTGETSIRYWSDDMDIPQPESGAVLERCQRLLAGAPFGAIRVCDITQGATTPQVGYDLVDDGPRTWQVTHVHATPSATFSIGTPDRELELELELLHGTLKRVQHRAAPHLVTVLSDRGVGDSWLMREFERRIHEQDVHTRFVVCQTPPPHSAHRHSPVPSAIVSSCCAITPADSATVAAGKLTGFLRQLLGSGESARKLTQLLRPLVDPSLSPSAAEVFESLRCFLHALALDCPLTLVLEDLHWATDDLLDFVESLGASLGDVPALIVVTARDDLLGRRPDWGGGMRRFSTIALDQPLAGNQEPAA
ncbi:BTAD domain-containing putative transcriptional regulator [Nocardia sp. NPDC050712]|uniref:BTAD domain-containing putative transcriptional regulator n=1 Tax=Nocardia sp. NPDC050712 TaxID=3155518 RepID=UPI00340E948E